MARKWGPKSTAVWNTLDPRLQEIMNFVLVTVADISLISGRRDEEEQNKLFKEGKSKHRYPRSKHNTFPFSQAVDFQPYPMPNIDAHDPKIRERERKRLWAALAYVAGAARVFAYANGHVIRWGGDWDMDGDLTDQNFDDLFHLELIEIEDENPSIAGITGEPGSDDGTDDSVRSEEDPTGDDGTSEL